MPMYDISNEAQLKGLHLVFRRNLIQMGAWKVIGTLSKRPTLQYLNVETVSVPFKHNYWYLIRLTITYSGASLGRQTRFFALLGPSRSILLHSKHTNDALC